MKKILKHSAWGLMLPLAFSCGQGSNNAQKTIKLSADTVKQCYTAAYEKDSAFLNLNIIDSNKIEGNLTVNYAEKPHNNGIVRGEFKGDTLFVDYTFKTGNNTTEFSNPLAFLKKGDTLVMGVGVIETSMGRSYFAKDKPINFERGKFNFAPAACKE